MISKTFPETLSYLIKRDRKGARPIFEAKFLGLSFGEVVYENGDVEHYRFGKLHRDNGPAVIQKNGNQFYYRNGKLHRDDGPAVILAVEERRYDGMKFPAGTQIYFKNGVVHRDDGPAIIFPDGSQFYFKNGKLHRDGDLPAVIRADGSREYRKNGKLHRDGDLPAVIRADGSREYHKNGRLHRDDGLPAIEYSDGGRMYYVNGYPHREGGPAVELADGTQRWYRKGVLHRDGGLPALVNDTNGFYGTYTAWYVNGKYHRTDGPAVEWANGMKEWYLNGKKVSREAFEVLKHWYQFKDGIRNTVKSIFDVVKSPLDSIKSALESLKKADHVDDRAVVYREWRDNGALQRKEYSSSFLKEAFEQKLGNNATATDFAEEDVRSRVVSRMR